MVDTALQLVGNRIMRRFPNRIKSVRGICPHSITRLIRISNCTTRCSCPTDKGIAGFCKSIGNQFCDLIGMNGLFLHRTGTAVCVKRHLVGIGFKDGIKNNRFILIVFFQRFPFRICNCSPSVTAVNQPTKVYPARTRTGMVKLPSRMTATVLAPIFPVDLP